MNLVQIQERLKDAPMQAVMQYANGTNPMVPPYLALAELQRRQAVNQSAQAQQAMQQGQKPSVKEQIEQTAGLAALQQQMQQRGLQQLMGQAQPQGIPENVPQPRRQPESEGIGSLPMGSEMNFKEGGIIPFARGGDEGLQYRAGLQDIERRSMEKALREEMESSPIIKQLQAQQVRAMQAGDIQQAMAIKQQIEDVKAGRARGRGAETHPVPVAPMDEAAGMPRQAAMAARPGMPQGVPEGAIPPPGARPSGPLPAPGGLPGQLSLPERRMGAAPAGAPMPQAGGQAERPAGIAALPGTDKARQIMEAAMGEPPTAQKAREQEQELRGLYGLTDQYGAAREQRIKEMQAARQQELEGRGLERLMQVLGGMQYQGLGGAGTAYLKAKESERAADAAFRKQMDELLGGVEEKRRAEAEAGMKAAREIMTKGKEAQHGAAKDIMDFETRNKQLELQSKALTGKLSAEEEYLRKRMNEGVPYPKALAEILEVKGGGKEELQDAKRREAAVKMATDAWNSPMRENPQNLPEAEWIRQKAEMIYKTQLALGSGAGTSVAIPQQAIDDLKKNPQLRAQFDAKYGAGLSAKYLGQ